MDRLRFGTGGIPVSTPRKTTVNGIKRIRELGLDAMEIEFVRGVRMSESTALEVRRVAEELDVVLTAHAPYYINLCSDDRSKFEASVQRIIDTVKIGWVAGVWSVVFHPGYYGKLSSEEAYRRVREGIAKVLEFVQSNGIDLWIRPEVMGTHSEFGTLEEIVRLAAEFGPPVAPCIDFAHLHARSLGRYNTYEEFRSVLEYLEKELGKEILSAMHIHVCGVEYGSKGEEKHVNLPETSFDYRTLMRVLKEFNVRGVVISESPDLEGDALRMKRAYEEA